MLTAAFILTPSDCTEETSSPKTANADEQTRSVESKTITRSNAAFAQLERFDTCSDPAVLDLEELF